MTELQLVAYTELHAALVKHGRHDWIEDTPNTARPCPAIYHGKCECGLLETIELLDPKTVGIV